MKFCPDLLLWRSVNMGIRQLILPSRILALDTHKRNSPLMMMVLPKTSPSIHWMRAVMCHHQPTSHHLQCIILLLLHIHHVVSLLLHTPLLQCTYHLCLTIYHLRLITNPQLSAPHVHLLHHRSVVRIRLLIHVLYFAHSTHLIVVLD